MDPLTPLRRTFLKPAFLGCRFFCACRSFRRLLDQHDDASAGDQQGTGHDAGRCGFFEEEHRQGDGDDHAQFVNGGDARHVSRLEGLEVEEPGESRGDSREDEEEPRVGSDLADGSGLMPENHDTPRQYQDDGGTYCRGEIRIDLSDADFGKDGRQSGEQGREQGIVFPHGFEQVEGLGGGVRVRKKCDPQGSHFSLSRQVSGPGPPSLN